MPNGRNSVKRSHGWKTKLFPERRYISDWGDKWIYRIIVFREKKILTQPLQSSSTQWKLQYRHKFYSFSNRIDYCSNIYYLSAFIHAFKNESLTHCNIPWDTLYIPPIKLNSNLKSVVSALLKWKSFKYGR